MPTPHDLASRVPFWQPVLLGAMAGGMGWGIRGQYGHETGAMIAGLLLGLVLALIFRPAGASLLVARAVAFCTIAMGFGGSMTYGQTVGLTHDAPLVGNWAALRWGMLGLAIKGGLWIGFAGAFLGMGLGGKRYRPGEILLVHLGLLGLWALGVWLLNSPFDPASKVLPSIYFSDDWRWEPGADLKPRPEVWGGFLLALCGLLAYTRLARRDSLALRLGLWGVLGGAIGFPLGQGLQAYPAWNPEVFRTGIWADLDRHMNWWNHMETTFGATMGGVLALGVWWNRERIAALEEDAPSELGPAVEGVLAAVHAALVVMQEFFSVPVVEWLYDNGLVLGLVMLVAVAGGRWWPYLLILPVTALPIAGKTLRELVYRSPAIAPVPGWALYILLPLTLTTLAACYFARRPPDARAAFLRPALLLAAWLYFGLNYAFFRFPWPWAEWTSRTPNAIVFTVCLLGLTWAALFSGRRHLGRTPIA